LILNYQKIQSSDWEAQLSGIVVKSTPLGVRIISSLTKSCQSINKSSNLQIFDPFFLQNFYTGFPCLKNAKNGLKIFQKQNFAGKLFD